MNFASFFDTYLTTERLTANQVIVCTISAIVLGFLICLIYMFTHKKTGYSQSFILTMIMLPAIVAIIIMVVGDNMAKAFSLAGAFSLIRFRSSLESTTDISYVFFSLAIGLSCGMGYIGYSFVFFVVLGAIMTVLNYINFGSSPVTNMALKITIPENLNYQGMFDSVLNANTTSWSLKRVKTVEFGSLFELIYDVHIKNDIDQKAFIDSIRTLNGNLNVTLILSRNEDKIYNG